MLRIAIVVVALLLIMLVFRVASICAAINQLGDRFPISNPYDGTDVSGLQWTSDGAQILFSYLGNTYVFDVEGYSLKRISDDSFAAAISSDGSFIAYSSFRHDGRWPWGEDEQWEIVTSRLDGSDERRLTRSVENYVLNLYPAWSPDSARIAFVSNSTIVNTPSEERGHVPYRTIFTMSSDGADMLRQP